MSMSSDRSRSLRPYSALSESQQAAIDALYSGNRLLVAPKGFGKAVVGQTAAQELIEDGHVNRVLVLAPLKVCQLTWATEHEHWAHLSPVALALGDESERRAAFAREARIVVMNFDNLLWFADTYGGKNGTLADCDGLLVDESTKLKAAGGTGFKALRGLLRYFHWRCAMTADPVAEMGVDIYTQAMIVDGGRALGRNLDAFRRKYFYPTDFQQRKWAVLPGMDKALADVLQDVLAVVRDDAYEAALPALEDRVVDVDMGPFARQWYDRLESGFLDLGAGVVCDDAAGVVGKQRQITAGAVYDVDGVAHWVHVAKIEVLRRLVDDIREPVLVAYQYVFELEMLRETWPDIVVLGDDPAGAERAWNAGAVRLMAVHPANCSHGLNLQYGGSHLIVLTAPWGADPWEQLVGRLRRRGQRAAVVTRITLAVPGTVDDEILARHELKRHAAQTLNAALSG